MKLLAVSRLTINRCPVRISVSAFVIPEEVNSIYEQFTQKIKLVVDIFPILPSTAFHL
jgi:hypothetical protein